MTAVISTPVSTHTPTSISWRTRARLSLPGWVAGALWAALVAAAASAAWLMPETPRAAGLSAVVALLTLFVAAIVATFALRYMRADPRRAGFFATIALLVGSVLGFVLARDLVTLAAAWCASGLLLARLIGHDRTWP
jgi:NAD(P)H-quinone oxidoreductase subunit 5